MRRRDAYRIFVRCSGGEATLARGRSGGLVDMTAEYLVGRADAVLDADQQRYADALFAAGRYEGESYSRLHFEHSTFANNSLKGSTFDRCTFINVAFVGVYFRDTVLKECRFEGCKFVNCDMSRVDIRSCDVKYYNVFSQTHVPYDRISESLPSEGNLRRLLCENLSREASSVGEFGDAGRFRAAAMQGQIRFLRAVMARKSPYYHEKYDPADQVRAAFSLVKLKLFNAIWGATRSHWIVLRNWVFLAAIAFLTFALLGYDSVGRDSTWWRAGFYGALATVPITPPQDYAVADPILQLLTVAFRFLGLMFAAIFAALLFARAYEGRR